MATVNPTEAVPLNANSVLSINMSHVSKLISSNYLAWSLQVRSFLNGYGLVAHLDENTHIPPETIIINDVTTLNHEYTRWIRQDNLIYSAMLGAISTSLQPLVSRCTTAASIWKTLADTYAKPSRGHVKQLKNQLKHVSKGALKIDDYVQSIKTKLDQLTLLGKPIEHEDAVDIVLDGLPEEYKCIVDQIESKDVAPSIAEIHERLLNHEAKLLCSASSKDQLFWLASQTHPTNFKINSIAS